MNENVVAATMTNLYGDSDVLHAFPKGSPRYMDVSFTFTVEMFLKLLNHEWQNSGYYAYFKDAWEDTAVVGVKHNGANINIEIMLFDDEETGLVRHIMTYMTLRRGDQNNEKRFVHYFLVSAHVCKTSDGTFSYDDAKDILSSAERQETSPGVLVERVDHDGLTFEQVEECFDEQNTLISCAIQPNGTAPHGDVINDYCEYMSGVARIVEESHRNTLDLMERRGKPAGYGYKLVYRKARKLKKSIENGEPNLNLAQELFGVFYDRTTLKEDVNRLLSYVVKPTGNTLHAIISLCMLSRSISASVSKENVTLHIGSMSRLLDDIRIAPETFGMILTAFNTSRDVRFID